MVCVREIKYLLFLSHQSSKKTDARTPDDKTKTETAPVSKAGKDKETEDEKTGDEKKPEVVKKTSTPLKKRK